MLYIPCWVDYNYLFFWFHIICRLVDYWSVHWVNEPFHFGPFLIALFLFVWFFWRGPPITTISWISPFDCLNVFRGESIFKDLSWFFPLFFLLFFLLKDIIVFFCFNIFLFAFFEFFYEILYLFLLNSVFLFLLSFFGVIYLLSSSYSCSCLSFFCLFGFLFFGFFGFFFLFLLWTFIY